FLLRPILFAAPARRDVGRGPPLYPVFRAQHRETGAGVPRRHDVHRHRHRALGSAARSADELWFLDGWTPERDAVGRGSGRVLDLAGAGERARVGAGGDRAAGQSSTRSGRRARAVGDFDRGEHRLRDPADGVSTVGPHPPSGDAHRGARRRALPRDPRSSHRTARPVVLLRADQHVPRRVRDQTRVTSSQDGRSARSVGGHMTPTWSVGVLRLAGYVALAGAVMRVPLRAQQPPARLATFLQQHIGPDSARIAAIERGDAVVKVLETDIKRDVAVFGIITVDVPRRFYVTRLQDFPNSLRARTRP